MQRRALIGAAIASGVVLVWAINPKAPSQGSLIVDGIAPEFRILHVVKHGRPVRDEKADHHQKRDPGGEAGEQPRHEEDADDQLQPG